MAEPQFADELFPEKQQFADDLFPASVDADVARQKMGASPIQDFLFSRDNVSVGRILSHFGQGFKEGWGQESLGLSDKSTKYLRESGWFNDYDAGQRNISKAANEAIFRPSAWVLDAGWRTLAGGVKGVGEVIAGTGRDVGQPQLGRDVAAMVTEAFPHARPIKGTAGIPHVERVTESGETLLLRARAANIIGAGERGWKSSAAGPEAPPSAVAGAVEAPRPPDINTAAREIAPDVFTKYDDALARRDIASDQVAELDVMKPGNPAQAAEIADLRARLQEQAKAAEIEARELSPAVKEAYAEARKSVPDEAPPAAPPVEEPAPAATGPVKPIEEQRAFIQSDIKEKLIAAGRPADEAEAAAAIDAAYWETRAARFNGKKGTADEMYRAEAPEIVAETKQRAVTMAQKDELFQREQTPEFKRWFGDSKVVDPDGRPLVVYHGTTNADKILGTGFKKGWVHLTDSKTVADSYKEWVKGNSPDTLHVYAKIENPAYYDAGGQKYTDIGNKVFRATWDAEKAGHDGIIIKNIRDNQDSSIAVQPHTTFVVFDSKQVKSATDNRGTFDPNSANILEQGGDIKRGRIRLREDGQNTITLLKDANASTFLHEKGHDYLARLVKDAVDPDAPVQLKADAEAVYRWLGVEKADDIKTRHHEKFARGFENYIMEGRAPSHALARVFEQFRQWLLRIYAEASKLKAPLNDEIRGVFDRMLAVDPEQVVIAPDRAPERMATRHEAIAEGSPASVAGDMAGAVRAERDTMAGRLPPEAQDARLAEIRAGLEGRAPRSAEPLRDGNAPESAPGGGRVAEEPGAVSASGGEVAPQAPSMAAEPSPRVGAKPTSPHESFAPSETADKAGNIRLDLLNAPDDVKRVISQVAEENDNFQRVRGPVSDVQVAELADAMGMDAQYLSTRKMGEAWTAPQIVALRNMLIQSATDVRNKMILAATGDEAAIMAYAEAKTRHMMIQERVSSVTSEAGRALRAFQKKFTKGMEEAQSVGDFLKQSTGQTLFQLQREAQLGASLETPSQVSKFIHDSRRATASEMVQEAWINALLSGPITHVKNIIGNTVVAVLGATETAGAAGVGKVRSMLGSKGERVLANEAQASLFGLIQGAQDGIRAAKYAFLHEEQYTRAQTLEQGKFQAIPSKRVVLKTYEEGSPQYNKRLDSIANARATAERLTGEAHTTRVAELKASPTADMVAEAKERAVEIGGKQIRTPGRMLTAEDEFFKTVAYRQKLNELAYRQANKENLSGDTFNQRVAQLTMSPPEDMMTAASKHADYQTFTNALGNTGRAIQNFSNSHLLAKMVVPFVRTPLNLLKFANERTPLGIFSREVRANLSGVNGKIAQDTQIARMAIGTSLAVTAMKLADEGYITGAGPSDKNERATLMLSGWRPYSVKIGEHYYSYGWLDPFSTIWGIAADLADAYKNAGEAQELEKVAAHLIGSISKNLLSKSSLRGASDLMNAVTDWDRFGDKYVQNIAGTVVPSVVAQRARTQDEFQREARTVLDNIKSRIPGLREDLLPKRDIWGEPIRAGESLGPDAFSPLAMSKLTNDPATKALIDAGMFPAKVDRKIRGVELTDHQYDDLARVAGRMAKTRVDALVSNQGFHSAPVEIRAEMLKKVIDASREAARAMIMMQNPEIIRKALDEKMSRVGR